MEANYFGFCGKNIVIPAEDVQEQIKMDLDKFIFYRQTFRKFQMNNNFNPNILVSKQIINSYKFLLFFRRIKNRNVCFLVDYTNIQDLKVYETFLKTDRSLYNKLGTIISGDLVFNNKGKWIYYIDNIHFYCGEPVYFKSLVNKIFIIGKFLKYQYKYDVFFNPFHIQLRSFFTLDHIELIETNTTLLFYPDDTRMDILVYEHTINIVDTTVSINKDDRKFLIVKGDKPDIYKMFENDEFFNIINVKTLKMNLDLKKLFKDKNEQTLDCKYDEITKSWVLV